MISKQILQSFGIEQKGFYESRIFKSHAAEISAAIQENQMTALIGGFGSGKSTLLNYAISQTEVTAIYVTDPDRERLRITHILNAALYDLCTENPRRDMEARTRQFTRVVGELHVRHKKQVCIIIENAHRIHANTFMALKDLRETPFAGVSPLFSVVLLGQGELSAKLERKKEVSYRTNILELTESRGWMDISSRVEYLEAVYGKALTEEVRIRVAAQHKAPLSMNHEIESKMKEAWQMGYSELRPEMFSKDIIDYKNILGASLNDIVEKSGIARSTVHEALSNPQHPKIQEIKEALNQIAQDKIQRKAA